MNGLRNAEKIVKKTWMKTRSRRAGTMFHVSVVLVALAAGGRAPARAGEAEKQAKPDDAAATTTDNIPSLSLDPTTPQLGALPGGVVPAYGQRSLSEGEWRFDFHGLILAPLNAGLNSRPCPMPGAPTCPQAGQSSRVLHTPPLVPDDLETFSHTGAVPTTYVQLNFSESNSIVSGNISIVSKQAEASESFIEPASQLGITDAFLAITPQLHPRLRTEIYVGAFTSRYGATGEYDEGRYGTPLIARVSGVGFRGAAKLALGDWVPMLEYGLVGQTNKAGNSTTPDVWNDFADPNAGSTFVSHVHAGVSLRNRAAIALHYLRAWSQDDRSTSNVVSDPTMVQNNPPDGSMDIYAADVRVTAGRFGHLYLAGSYIDARYIASLSRIISVLNTKGGQGLMDNYFGSNSSGYGKMTVIGAQYDLSIGKLVSYPTPFSGDGPDLYVSVFGMLATVKSADGYDGSATTTNSAGAPIQVPLADGETKLKYGIEATYSVLPWLAFSGRYDQVNPILADRRYSFAVVSPKVILRTDWMATNQIVLQYSHWFDGALTTVRTGDPPKPNPVTIPDSNMLSISAMMWW
jgi:hypothetical protein